MRFALALLLVVGCADASKQIEKLADRACACKDAACADKVIEDLVQFAKDNPTMTGDQEHGVEQAKRLTTCALSAGVDQAKLFDKLKAIQGVH
jgi:hypothetical protein